MAKNNQKKSTRPLRILLSLFVPLMSIVAVIFLARASILPTKYLLPTSIAWLILSSLISYGLSRIDKTRQTRSIISIISALIIIAANTAIISVANNFNSFFSSVQESTIKTEPYNLIVLDSETCAANSTPGIAYLSSDVYASDVKDFIASKLSAAQIDYPDPTTLSVALTEQKIESALIHDSYLSLYELHYEEFFGSIAVVATYDVPITQQQLEETEKQSIKEPFILYISGIDTTNNTLPLSARSDVNIVIVINPNTHKILTINTPRDYYVNLATSGKKDKLTHAGVYGVSESMKTLASLYDTSIDYYARVNFNTLIKVVDIIGGIDVYSETSFKSSSGPSFVEGINHLDGESALAFARERKSLMGGDRTRGEHQQAIIEAVFKKIIKPETLVHATSILNTLADSLQTNLSPESLKTLIYDQLDTMAEWTFENISVDGTGDMQPTYSMGSQKLYVMWPNADTVNVAKTKIAEILAN